MSVHIDPTHLAKGWWPTLGTTYKTLEDALLTTQLAALRAGFNSVEIKREERTPEKRWIRCKNRTEGDRTNLCSATLIVVRLINPGSHKEGWIVVNTLPEYFESIRHPKHRNMSEPLTVSLLLIFSQLSLPSP